MPEFSVESCTDSIVDFIHSLNHRPEHNCGYLSEDAEQLRIDICELLEAEDCLLICCKNSGKLAGVAVFDGDSEEGKAEVIGPFIAMDFIGDFQTLAKGFIDYYKMSCPEINKLLFFPSKENTFAKDFLVFEKALFKGSHVTLSIQREHFCINSTLDTDCLMPHEYPLFTRLHDSIFPHTYYSGEDITGFLNDCKKVYVVRDNSQLIGYLYAELDPVTKDSGIEFLGVTEARRKQGLGTRLLRMALCDLFINMGAAQVRLCVSVENEGALSLYKRLGFGAVKEYEAYELVFD